MAKRPGRYLHEQPSFVQLTASYHDFLRLFQATNDDVKESISRMLAEGRVEERMRQFWKRTIVRAVLADIEGTIHALKGFVLELLALFPVPVSKNEREVLEKGWGFPTLRSIRVTLGVLARVVYGKPYVAGFQDAEWQELDTAIRLRHRITHPKAAIDLEIGEPEFKQFLASRVAFSSVLEGLLNDLGDRLPRLKGTAKTFKRTGPRVGRNEPCPCGSGRKFKTCHGADEGVLASGNSEAFDLSQ